MPQISLENIQTLATKAYISHAEAAFGAAGASGIRDLLNWVRLFFQRFPPEGIAGNLTVVLGISTTPLTPLTNGQRLKGVAEVGAFLASATDKCLVVEILPDQTFLCSDSEQELDLKETAKHALVYRLDSNAERILAGVHADFVPPISPVLRSNFAPPTLSSLEEALERYGAYARESKCRILKDIWEGSVDGARLVLVNKPESLMRDSLAQALELMLQDATVKPEQNTDETKPVDIRVNWFASGAVALIEVKWLGKSIAQQAVAERGATYTEYSASRAQSGANQLADYMDREVRHSEATAPRGYLVIFDARRKGTKGPTDRLTQADAMAFANSKLTFDPDHSRLRNDFALPVRFFLSPRKSFFLAA